MLHCEIGWRSSARKHRPLNAFGQTGLLAQRRQACQAFDSPLPRSRSIEQGLAWPVRPCRRWWPRAGLLTSRLGGSFGWSAGRGQCGIGCRAGTSSGRVDPANNGIVADLIECKRICEAGFRFPAGAASGCFKLRDTAIGCAPLNCTALSAKSQRLYFDWLSQSKWLTFGGGS